MQQHFIENKPAITDSKSFAKHYHLDFQEFDRDSRFFRTSTDVLKIFDRRQAAVITMEFACPTGALVAVTYQKNNQPSSCKRSDYTFGDFALTTTQFATDGSPRRLERNYDREGILKGERKTAEEEECHPLFDERAFIAGFRPLLDKADLPNLSRSGGGLSPDEQIYRRIVGYFKQNPEIQPHVLPPEYEMPATVARERVHPRMA